MFSYLNSHHPEIALHVEEARVETIKRKLHRAEIDIAILATPTTDSGLLEIPIFRERYFAYLHPSEHNYGKESLDTQSLTADNIWVLGESYCPNIGQFPFCVRDMTNASIYAGPKVIEYNCRFGDPETQVVLPLLDTDLYDIFEAIYDERLSELDIKWKNESCACVILASGGYPKSYEKGKEIYMTEEAEKATFVAGAKLENGKLLTNGGLICIWLKLLWILLPNIVNQINMV